MLILHTFSIEIAMATADLLTWMKYYHSMDEILSRMFLLQGF